MQTQGEPLYHFWLQTVISVTTPLPPPTHISPPPSNYLLNFSMSRSASSMSLLSSSSSGLGINTSSEKNSQEFTSWKLPGKKNTTKPSNLVQTNLVQTRAHLQNYIFVQFSVWHSCICADCKGDAPRPLIPTPLYPASGSLFTTGPKDEKPKHSTHILFSYSYWAVQAGLLTPLIFAWRCLSPLSAFTSSAFFLHNGKRWQWICEFYTANFKGIFGGLQSECVWQQAINCCSCYKMPQNAFFFSLMNSWSSGQPKNDTKTFFSTLHPLSLVIFATATVVVFVLLHNSRFNFHCYTQHEATPTHKSAQK